MNNYSDLHELFTYLPNSKAIHTYSLINLITITVYTTNSNNKINKKH